MHLPTPTIILGTLVIATVVVAYVGDLVGKTIGKRRLTVFGLRPRHTGILISVLTGVLILAMAVTAMAVSSQQVRDALFNIDRLRGEQKELRLENKRLEGQAKGLRGEADELKAERNRLRGRAGELQEQTGQLQSEARTSALALKRTKAELGKTAQRLAGIRTQYEEQRTVLDKTNAELADATAEAELIAQRLDSKRQELEQTTRELARVQKEREAAEEEKRQREGIVERLGPEIIRLDGEIARLEQDKQHLSEERSRLEQEIKQLEEFAKPLIEIATRAREGDVIYEANQLIACRLVKAPRPAEEVRADLAALLDEASEEAARAGAKPEKEGQRAVKIATRRRDTPTGPMYFWESNLLDLLSDDISKAEGSVLVELHSLRNYVAGEQINADIVLFVNRRVFAAGETLLERALDPAETEAALFRSILAALQDIRRVARRKGVRPDVTGQVGEVSYEQIFELLKRAKGREEAVTLRIVSADEAWTAGPLRVRFELKE